MRAPHELSAYELQKVGISWVGRAPLLLRCDQCGEQWQITKKGLRLPKGYWKCPNGCNA